MFYFQLPVGIFLVVSIKHSMGISPYTFAFAFFFQHLTSHAQGGQKYMFFICSENVSDHIYRSVDTGRCGWQTKLSRRISTRCGSVVMTQSPRSKCKEVCTGAKMDFLEAEGSSRAGGGGEGWGLESWREKKREKVRSAGGSS